MVIHEVTMVGLAMGQSLWVAIVDAEKARIAAATRCIFRGMFWTWTEVYTIYRR